VAYSHRDSLMSRFEGGVRHDIGRRMRQLLLVTHRFAGDSRKRARSRILARTGKQRRQQRRIRSGVTVDWRRGFSVHIHPDGIDAERCGTSFTIGYRRSSGLGTLHQGLHGIAVDRSSGLPKRARAIGYDRKVRQCKALDLRAMGFGCASWSPAPASRHALSGRRWHHARPGKTNICSSDRR